MLKNPEFSPAVSILIAGFLIAGAIIFVNVNPASSAAGDGAVRNNALPQNTSVPAPRASDHRYGSQDAPTVLIEYSDFECPYCESVYATLKRLVDESNGKVAWIMRHLPLESIHAEARPAALAAECVAEQLGDAGWFAFSERLFADQQNLGNALYLSLAGELGADTARYLSCVSSKKHDQRITDEAAEAQVAGASGTPFTVVVGGGAQVPVPGALPYEQFAAVIKAVQARQQ